MSKTIQVAVLIPVSTEFANEVYLQILQNSSLWKTSAYAINLQYIRVDPQSPVDSSTLEVNTKCVLITGLSSLVITSEFLTACQKILGPSTDGSRAPFTGNKLLLSQGLPAGEVLTENLINSLNMFDHIFLRSQLDLKLLQTSDKSETLTKRAQLWPDMIYLSKLFLSEGLDLSIQERNANDPVLLVYLPKRIAVRNPNYKRLLKSIIEGVENFCLQSSVKRKVDIQLLAFGTEDEMVANDFLIYANLTILAEYQLRVITLEPQIKDITEYFQMQVQSQPTCLLSYDVIATEIALLTNMFVISLSPADIKDGSMQRLANEVNMDSQSIVQVQISERYGRPESVDPTEVQKAIKSSDWTDGSDAHFPETQKDCIAAILKIVESTTSSTGILIGPSNSNESSPVGRENQVTALTTSQISDRVTTLLKGVASFHETREAYDPALLALFICFKITNKNETSKYLHGLTNLLQKFTTFQEAMQENRLEQAIRWLVKDAFKNGLTYDFVSSPTPPAWLTHSPFSVFDLQANFSISLDSFFRQSEYKGVHRSGWAYVVSGLAALTANSAAGGDDPVFLDTYLDASMGWMEPVLAFEGILPYKKPWSGVLHHGYNNAEGYNVESVLQKATFQASLPQCRCLITLSEDLKSKVEAGLLKLQETDPSLCIPPVVALVHPTESVSRELQFNMEAFVANTQRKVIQVGSFYRNSYAIYALPIGGEYANEVALEKCHLRAVDSARYFRPTNLFDKIATMDFESDSQHETGSISRSICGSSNGCISRSICGTSTETNNVYVKGLIEIAKTMDASVTVLEHVNHAEYDTLLAQNIVFINLIDCSGCNTLIETIVRNTPILINPLPAVVEVLGIHYPFFYETLTEAAAKANSLETIEATHQYLKKLDKSKYQLDVFLNDFQSKVGPYIKSETKAKANNKKRLSSSSKVSQSKCKKHKK